LSNLIAAILAGIMISVSAVAYLSVDSRYLGAALFSVGLIIILSYGLLLFTNKSGYILSDNSKQKFQLVFIWLGNLIGTVGTGYLLRLTRVADKLSSRAGSLSRGMLSDGIISNLLLALFCGILMFVAADNFKNAKNNIEKYLLVIMSVMAFLLCGFEHCVFNMFLFSVSNCWSIKAALYIIVMTVGNMLGSIVIPLSHKAVEIIRKRV
jgi:formate/nitrite transporter FocA (FNT family)